MKTESNEKEAKYIDYVVSLGGNCALAKQAHIRELRPCSFPFDYFWLRDENDLKKMIKELKADFANSFKKENLIELTGDKRGTSKLYQYQDTVSGYNIIHLFKKPADEYYEEAYSTITRRLNRLKALQYKNKKLCFALTINFYTSRKNLREIAEILLEKYGQNIDIYFILWNSGFDREIKEGNINYIYSAGGFNDYDFNNTNYIWHFLDKYKLIEQKENQYFCIKQIKKGIQIKILQLINTLFRFRIYIFGFRLDICIGKPRD